MNELPGVIPTEQHSGAVIPVSLPPEELSADHGTEERGEKPAEPAGGYSDRPKLPRHPMISGVLTFVFQPGTAIYAGVLSIWAAVLLGIGLAALHLGGIETAAAWAGSMVLTGLTSLLSLIWLVVASGCLLCVLHDSAAGNARVENWPDTVWLDWIADSLFLVTSAVGSLGVGLAVAWVCRRMGVQTWEPLPASLFVLFPIMLLSTLEMQSPLLPVSPIVLRSMARSWMAWAAFYLETALVVVIPPASFWLMSVLCGGTDLGGRATSMGTTGFELNVFRIGVDLAGAGLRVLVPVISVTAAAAVISAMVYFRLLGRLAWVCAEDLRAAEKQREELDAEGTDEDDDSNPDIRPTPVNDF